MMVFMAPLIKFYTKPECSLCDEARTLLNLLKKEYPFDVEEVNILDDPNLYQHYKYEIPVLLFPDQFQLKGRIDREQLRDKLDQILCLSDKP